MNKYIHKVRSLINEQLPHSPPNKVVIHILNSDPSLNLIHKTLMTLMHTIKRQFAKVISKKYLKERAKSSEPKIKTSIVKHFIKIVVQVSDLFDAENGTSLLPKTIG